VGKRVRIGVVLLWFLLVLPQQGTAQEQETPMQHDQRAAMHNSTRSDIEHYGDVPRYQITGVITPQTQTLQATQKLFYVNKSTDPLDRLYFRLFPNLDDMGGAVVITAARINEQAVPFTSEAGEYLVRIDLAEPLASGATIVVALDFATTMPYNKGQQWYGAMNDDGASLSLASAYPIIANYANGRWETEIPDTKGDMVNSPVALYDVTLTAPSNYSIVTTGTTTQIIKNGNTQTIHVVSGLQRDFTLVATTLPRVSGSIDGTRINVYYPTGNIRGGRLALKFARQAIQLFNVKFGQYPYNELDIVAVDAGTFYGVEYPGLTLIRRDLFATSWLLESIIAHEIAHQWFYNVIGNDVQQHAWVDESLATYAQVIYREAVWGQPAAKIEGDDWVVRYERLKTRNADGPIARHMRDFTLYTYNVLAYDKAALYLAALRAQIGDDAFFAALQRYYHDNRYAYVDSSALTNAIQQTCNCDIQPLYASWVLAR
jgi:hypothetical protein